MPSYSFICENKKCGHTEETFLWISELDDYLKCCPKCGSKKWRQNYSENTNVIGWTYGEDRATTLGQQAIYNAKRVGKEQIEKSEEKYRKLKKAKEHIPFWRDGSIEHTKKMEKPLDITTVRDLQKYVNTGEKS